MNEQQWRSERNDRTLRYAGRILDENRFLLLNADEQYASRYDGQVAIITATNLLGRMTPSIALDIPSVHIVDPLPWAGHDLTEFLLHNLRCADPYGHFTSRDYRAGDCILRFGRVGDGCIIHGSGWDSYIGPSPSPLKPMSEPNPIGPAMAAVLMAAGVFNNNFDISKTHTALNCLDWTHNILTATEHQVPSHLDLGNIWTIGVGSVGTAILYILTLLTRDFYASLFDMDTVKIHNLDRSPMFNNNNVGKFKVDVAQQYLSQIGLNGVIVEKCALDESLLWQQRQHGTPDLLIAAANERNVRPIVEANFPPTQIYGTTGRNWQSSVIRHIAMVDPCSFCLFPNTEAAPTSCATGNTTTLNGEQRNDASLPFLSFAAGIMAAAEILKLPLPGYPFSPNRVVLNTMPYPRAVHAPLVVRPGCFCQSRSREVHHKMIRDSRYSYLSYR